MTTEIGVSADSLSYADAFIDFLIDSGRLPRVAADRLHLVHEGTEDRIAAVILKLGLMSEDALAEAMCEFMDIEPLAVSDLQATPLTGKRWNVAFLQNHEVLPLEAEQDALRVACWDALDGYARDALEFASGLAVKRYILPRSKLLAALHATYPIQPLPQLDTSDPENGVEVEELDRLKDLASDTPIIRLVQRLIESAVRQRASDIHFEASESALHVRYRMDGLLRQIESQTKELGPPVISRIKVMAGLNIAERRLPQDGRIRVSVDGREVDFRVATSPTLHGESVVLRILDRRDVSLDFDSLGFDGPLKTLLRQAIAKPHGIVLVTGPTGSGKTTTLYAALKEINTPEKKILTVEDPVEYSLEGVNQVPIKPQIGLTFASSLRAFLRQDPDVMMVGEIRDRETAEIAIQAALTGHLLLSTLHTNSAAASVTRLLDMGIDDYLLTSTLHLIVGQRLLRRLCVHCRQAYKPTPEASRRLGVHGESHSTWYRAVGCEQCQHGYAGRTNIAEALPMSDAVRSAILTRADAHQIERIAVSEGMRTLLQHGLQRTTDGVTSIEEVLRVTNLS